MLRQSDQDLATVVSAGITLFEALAAYDTLKKMGLAIRVIDLYSIKPVAAAALADAARATGHSSPWKTTTRRGASAKR